MVKQILMVYSESGGVTKTSTAVSIAKCAADRGRRVVLADLDPRGATTKWLGVEPSGNGLHVGAILGNENPEGWAEELAVPSTWSPNLRVLPSARSVSNREAEREMYAELRLKMSFTGLEADYVVIDCPNRQGGPLTLSALNAADTVVYAANPTEDGVDGVEGAQRSVRKFQQSRTQMGAPVSLEEAGIVVGGVQETVMSRIAVASIETLRDTSIMLEPLIPHRAIVQEMRRTHEWYGDYRKGAPVLDAYRQITDKVLR